MATRELTLENFESTIQDNPIVLIDFWAEWCGPCRAFGPIFEKAAEKHEDVVFGKVNTEQQQALAGQLGIRSIPTLMIFRDNILLFAQPGMLPAEALDDLITQTRALDMDEVREKIAAHEKEQHEDTAKEATA